MRLGDLLKRYHLLMMLVWPLLAIPTFLWWKDAVWLVLALSLYANWIGDFSAYQAARAEDEANSNSESSGQPRLNAAYRERARLVAYLARQWPAMLHQPSPEEWPVIYIDTPAGQMSWHISDDDLDLFEDVPWLAADHPVPWDGHTTEQKYQRLERLPHV